MATTETTASARAAARLGATSMANKTTAPPICAVCRGPVAPWLDPEILHCPRCKYWGTSFAAEAAATSPLDERRRRAGLEPVRRAGATTILTALAHHRPLAGAALCDVGCGYGWFLEHAQARGMRVVGIEPDVAVAAVAAAAGVAVRVGGFPERLRADDRFDVVAFNDVFEHLRSVEQVLRTAARHLAPDGVLVLSVPSSRGTGFRLAALLRRLGRRRFWDRLWQRGSACPHAHYFDPDNLALLAARAGFTLLENVPLPSVTLRGLWSRLHMETGTPRLVAALAWVVVCLGWPVLRWMPSDAIVQLYVRPGARGGGASGPVSD